MAHSSSAFFPWLLCALAVSLVCHRSALGSAADAIEARKTTGLPRNVSLHNGSDMQSELEYEEGDYEEADDADSELILDGPVIAQPVVKPEGGAARKEEKKDHNKKNKKQRKNKGEKKQKLENPCNTTHQDFCFHGRCRYLKSLDKVACICDHNYVGERCSDIYMETTSFGDNTATTALAVVAVLLSTLSFIAIAIVIVAHMRKKYSVTYEGEAEEKKKLGHENRDVDV